ncbi:hypothetical protein FRC05_005909 [Tulasnella sp. 425]|nr:hypothetical protein FRC05_005909 [Tulasnella sp. 425]
MLADFTGNYLLAFMAGTHETADPGPHVNCSEIVKIKGASSASKLKPKAEPPRKRALKEDGVANGLLQKEARIFGMKSASGPTVAAMDVGRDLMDVIAAEEETNDKLGLAVGVPMLG